MATHAAILGVIVAVSLIRWRLMRGSNYPTGIDGGNWLAFGHAILGEHIRSSTLAYPPVVPLLAVACEWMLGLYAGVQALAFASAAAPALGTYVLLYGWGLRWRAVLLAGFLAASAATGEAMAWGGYPQLIGLGILPLFILALDRFLTSRSLVSALPPAFLLLASLATSDLIGPITVLVGSLYLVVRYVDLARRHEGNSGRNVLLGMGLSVLLALLMTPTYFGLVGGASSNEHAKLASQQSIASAISALNAVAQDLPSFWLAALLLAILSPLVLAMRGDRRLALLSASILVPSIALLVGAGERRIADLFPLGIIAGLGAWSEMISRTPQWGARAITAAVVTFLAVDVLIGTQYYAIQRNNYAVLNTGLVRGLDRLVAMSGSQQIIAVSPAPNDWALGWWVEGAARRPTVYAGDPIWLNYADEKARNAIANRIFSPQNNFELSRQEARDAGARYLFVDKGWSEYQTWASHGLRDDPAAIVYENESVLIISAGG